MERASLAAHTTPARVRLRRFSTLDMRGAHRRCHGCVTTTTHVDYNAFRDCALASSAAPRVGLFRSSCVTAVSGERTEPNPCSQQPGALTALQPRPSCICSNTPLANNDAPGSAVSTQRRIRRPSGMRIWYSLRSGCLQLPSWFHDLRLGRCGQFLRCLTTACCPWMCNRLIVIPGISFSQTDAAQFGQRLPLAASHIPVHNPHLAECTTRHAVLRSFHLHLHVFALCSAPEWNAVRRSWPLIWLRFFLRNGNPRTQVSIGLQSLARHSIRPIAGWGLTFHTYDSFPEQRSARASSIKWALSHANPQRPVCLLGDSLLVVGSNHCRVFNLPGQCC